MSSVRGEVSLEVCSKPASIAPTYRAIEAIELRLGIGLPAILSRLLSGDVRMRDLTICAQEGLRGAGQRGPNGKGDLIEYEELGEDVLQHFAAYSEAVSKMLANALGGGKPGKEQAPPPPG